MTNGSFFWSLMLPVFAETTEMQDLWRGGCGVFFFFFVPYLCPIYVFLGPKIKQNLTLKCATICFHRAKGNFSFFSFFKWIHAQNTFRVPPVWNP